MPRDPAKAGGNDRLAASCPPAPERALFRGAGAAAACVIRIFLRFSACYLTSENVAAE